MRNIAVLGMLFLSFAFAKAQKIKGNKEVTTRIIDLTEFQEVSIGEDFQVSLAEGFAPKVDIAASSNLHQYLTVEVKEGVLTIKSTADIRRNKDVKITVIYTPALKKITAFDDSQVSSLTDLRMPDLEVVVKDDAKVFLTGLVDNLIFNAMSGSKSECNLGGEKAQLNLNGSSDTKALLKYKQIDFMMTDRATARIEGDADESSMVLEGKSILTSKNLDLNELKLNITRDAQASVNVSKALELRASGSSKVILYDNPKIELVEFTGKTALMKD